MVQSRPFKNCITCYVILLISDIHISDYLKQNFIIFINKCILHLRSMCKTINKRNKKNTRQNKTIHTRRSCEFLHWLLDICVVPHCTEIKLSLSLLPVWSSKICRTRGVSCTNLVNDETWTQTYAGLYVNKVSWYFWQITTKAEYDRKMWIKMSNIKFQGKCPMAAELFYAERRTDSMKLITIFRNVPRRSLKCHESNKTNTAQSTVYRAPISAGV
jgi:hypothetical protein